MSSFKTKTIDDAVLETRQIVNDTFVPYRNLDATYIGYLNSALRALYSIRPDAFIGNFTQGVLSQTVVVTYTTADLQVIDGTANVLPPVPATPFPADDRQFFNPVVAYMAGRVELADDEYVDTARSSQLLASFKLMCTGS